MDRHYERIVLDRMTDSGVPASFSLVALKAYGFVGFLPVAALRGRRYRGAPRRGDDRRSLGGVYLAYRPSSALPQFLAVNPCGRWRGDLSKPVNVLRERWVPRSHVVYVGKADPTEAGNSLHTRVRTYLRFGEGHNARHAGGYRTWQLADSQDLLVAWKVIEAEPPLAVEARLLAAHAARYGRLPFANGS